MELTSHLQASDRDRVEGRLRNIVCVEGVISQADDQSPANQQPAYLAKYIERIEALSGTSERFAELLSIALIIAPTKLRA